MPRRTEPAQQSRVLAVVAGALVATIVLGWFGTVHPVLEMLTNVPMHLLVIAVLVLGSGLVRREPLPAIAGGLSAAWLAILLVPYWWASPAPPPEDPDAMHQVLQYNVYFGNDDVDRMVAEIESADAAVVALHEITSTQWEALAPRLSDYPHVVAEPWDGGALQLGGGMALLSRSPMSVLDVDPEASVTGRPVLAATTTIGGVEVVVVGLHPHASRFERAKADLRKRQLDAVIELLRHEDRPGLILTDMNMAPTSTSYRRTLSELGWADPHRSTGWDASWPTWAGPLGFPIDHVLVSNEVVLHDIWTTDGGGSDHRSVIAQFSFR